ncbi:hypothetical protein F2Q69_00043342 [Brassica cretica]|uniref:Uncharacterized protein n=1 Tax=Brassica cretica TaxID=69181 RepID=A0A8S9NKI0_BRACR|nr:hypothetical protein F2Q69_00043342 [Brassica cretica]
MSSDQIVETGPPREPRTDASWNELELKSRELIAVGARPDRMNTSWNACKNKLGFVGLGFKVAG